MKEFIIIKDKLKEFYGKNDFLIDHLIKFVLSLTAFLVINGNLDYNSKLGNKFLMIVLAAVCAFLPGGFTAVVCVGIILVQLISVGIEYAAIALVVFLLMFLMYFMFATKTSFILLLTPVLFLMKIPYVLPIVVGLTSGPVGVIPVLFGIYTYYLISFAPEFAAAATSFTEADFIQKLMYIIDNTILNKEMLVLFIVFAAIIVLVNVIKHLSFDYSWMIAVLTGGIVEAILVIMSFLMLDLQVSIPGLILGTILAIAVGIVMDFFIFSVDYSRKEYVQFEDDDYYYYVKAIPKYSVPKKQVKVKKINARKEESNEYSEHEMYQPEPMDEEDIERKRAYEQDVTDLDEDEQ